jgi:hypothetical protein
MEKLILTRRAWLDTIQHWVDKTVMGASDRALNIVPWWVETLEIRIMWEDGINNTTVQAVREAIEGRLAEVGLTGFTIKLYGSGWQEGRRRVKVSDYIRPGLVNGEVDHERLFELSYHEPYRQHRQHADVYITTHPFVNDTVSWGAAMFEYGCIVLTLYGDRQQSLSFLHNVVRHEMGHMLGMPIHCDDIGIGGVSYNRSCNMHYSVPSAHLCPKCRQFLQEWWRHLTRTA